MASPSLRSFITLNRSDRASPSSRPPSNIQHITQRTTYSVQHTAYNIQHPTCNSPSHPIPSHPCGKIKKEKSLHIASKGIISFLRLRCKKHFSPSSPMYNIRPLQVCCQRRQSKITLTHTRTIQTQVHTAHLQRGRWESRYYPWRNEGIANYND